MNQKILITFVLLVFLLRIGGSFLVGGYEPMIRGGLGMALWLLIIIAQVVAVIMMTYKVIASALQHKIGEVWTSLALLILLLIPAFLPLPGLFVK